MINDKDIDQYVARQLRALRITMGISQEVVAGEIGVTFQQIQKYERGINRVSSGRLYQLAEAFHVSVLAMFPERADYRSYDPIPPATVRLLRLINSIDPKHYGELHTVLKAMAKLSASAEV